MNSLKQTKLLLFSITFLLIGFSCEDDPISEQVIEDEDMLAATEMANSYLNAESGRTGSEAAITVLKFKDDKLWYATNLDGVISYVEIEEESITATVSSGGYVFWYSGGGVSDLDGIEFDEESQLQLVDAPEEINADKMWVISIPEDFDGEDGILKYDIVYKIKGSDTTIRLDPKIKVSH